MYDMGFKLSKSAVRPGIAVFRTVNDGAVEHDFRIKGLASPAGVGTPILGSGQRATLTVRFAKSGRYTYICTVPGHAAAGMKGKLIVKR
jgi:nitrite reductase (NO-forming)